MTTESALPRTAASSASPGEAPGWPDEELAELRDFFENAAVGMHWVGADGTILRANRAELAFMGYAAEEYIGRHIAEFHADRDVIDDILARLTRGEVLHDYEARLRCKDGTIKDVLIDSSALFRDGEFIHTRCITRDNTARKRAEDAVQQHEARREALAASVPFITWLTDASGALSYVNPRWVEYTGRALEENIAAGWAAVLHPDDLGAREAELPAILAAGKPYQDRHRLCDAYGEYRWHQTQVVPLRDASGEVTGWLGSSVDVHPQAIAEQALRESEERWRSLTNSLPALVFTAEASMATGWFSGRWTEYTGVAQDELLGKGWRSVCHPEDLDRILGDWARARRAGEAISGEWRVRGADGAYRWFLGNASPIRNAAGEITSWVGASVDIDAAKRGEEGIRLSEERAQLALKSSDLGIWDWKVGEDRAEWSARSYEIFGVTEDQFDGSFASFLDMVHPDDRAACAQVVADALEREQEFTQEHRIVRRDGEVRWIRGPGVIFRDALGTAIRAIGVIEDVTDRRLAEQALRESEDRYRRIIETANEGILIIDVDGVITYANDRLAGMLGYERGQLMGRPFSAFMDDDARIQARENLDRRRQGISEQFDFRFRHADGSPVWVIVGATPITAADGTFAGSLAMITDVTERRSTDEALRASEARARAVLETAVDGIITMDERGFVESMNPAAVRLFGYDAKEVVGQKINMLMPPPERDEHDVYVTHYLDTGERKIIGIGREVLGQRKDGTTFPFDLSVSEVLVGGRRMFTGIVHDVSARRQAEDALHDALIDTEEAREVLDSIISTTPVGIALLDRDLRFVQINDEAAAINGVPAADHRGRRVDEVLPDVDPSAWELMRQVLETGEPVRNIEITGETPQAPGVKRWWNESFYPVRGARGEIIGVGAAFIEISDRKRIERDQTLLAQLGEALASSLDRDETVASVLRACVPAFADYVAVYTRTPDGAVERYTRSDVDDRVTRSRYPVEDLADAPVAAAMRDGRAILLPAITDDDVRRATRERSLQAMRDLHVTSAIVVPVWARGAVIGALSFNTAGESQRYDNEDITLALEVARRVGLALENAPAGRSHGQSSTPGGPRGSYSVSGNSGS